MSSDRVAAILNQLRSATERTITAVSQPRPRRKPAHSSATYDAPMTSVLPGGFASEKMSSELTHSSRAPGISGRRGRPPGASTNVSAVSVSSAPSASTQRSVFSSVKLANAL